MARIRSILSLILVAVATLLISCSSPNVAKAPTTYSPEKIQQIETYLVRVQEARELMPELQALIQDEDWVNIQSLIHGPLGQFRQQVSNLNRTLLSKDQKQATELSKEIFTRLEGIDAAAKARNYLTAIKESGRAVQDFDAYLDLIPTKGDSA